MNLRFVLLGLLSKEPNTGYGLDRLLRGDASHLWTTSLQHIYAELANMQADGLIDAESIEVPNRPIKKKMYSLTRLGEERLDTLLAESIKMPAIKDDLLIRLYCMERMPPSDLRREIEVHLGDIEREEKLIKRLILAASRGADASGGLLLTLEMTRGQLQSRMASCRRILSLLERADMGAPAAPPLQETA